MGILPQTLAFPFRTGREGRMRVLLWALRRSNAHPSLTGGFAQKVGFGASFCIFDTMKISILL
jgi:hypothetical protein